LVVFFPPPPFGVVAVQPTQSSPTPLSPVLILLFPFREVPSRYQKVPISTIALPFSFLHWSSLFLQSMRYVRVNKNDVTHQPLANFPL
jgi:hypothetical protein